VPAASNTLSNSQRLRYKAALALPKLTAINNSFWDHPRIAELYPEYLFTTHCMSRATVPLMEAALGRARELAAQDSVADKLTPYLAKHISEERHAHWWLEDLEELGRERTAILRRQPPATVAAMVGSQYYWIFHHHPVALVGYMEIMEGYPLSIEHAEGLSVRTGYPRTAFRTMLRHAHLDLHHRKELREVIDDLPLSPEQEALVGLSALQTIALGGNAIREIIARYDGRAVE
jgi:hypothetical protein